MITITNQGLGTAEPFWADFYINPSETPGPNRVWNQLCSLDPCFGIAWGVGQQLAPGESITLRSTVDQISAEHSVWPGWFAAGSHTLALYVDSFGPRASGNMDESREDNNLVVKEIPPVGGSNPAVAATSATGSFPARQAPTPQR